MSYITDPREDALYKRVAPIIESARLHVSRTVNTAMVHAYWLIGQGIVEVEQRGKERAEYGERLLERLSRRLGEHFGRGYSVPNLRNMRQFYLAFPQAPCCQVQRFARHCLANLRGQTSPRRHLGS